MHVCMLKHENGSMQNAPNRAQCKVVTAHNVELVLTGQLQHVQGNCLNVIAVDRYTGSKPYALERSAAQCSTVQHKW